jgi:hypothetical protein
LKTNWHGLKNAPENVLEIVKPFLAYIHLDIIPLTPLPNEDFEDLLTLSNMLAHIQTFWETFIEQQFNNNFATEPDKWYNNMDFWMIESFSTFSAESTFTNTTEDSEIFNLEECDIHIIYPYIILVIELQKRCIIVIHSRESYYEQNPDEPKEDFWLATIICPKLLGNDRIEEVELLDEINSRDEYEIPYIKFLVYMMVISIMGVGILGFEKEEMSILSYGP